MLLALGSYLLSAAAIVGAWAWLGDEIAMPPAPIADKDKLYCVSYAPFRGRQTPLDRTTQIDPRQIEQDLVRLKAITGCVRTYSNDFNLDLLPGIARRHGLKVIQGLWLSGHADRNQLQIDTAIRLANTYPDVIRALVVGNEALLRGEISAADLATTIGRVKAKVPVPVTYADVWEFWLRHRELAGVVDFVTVHILPYWEDFPIEAGQAAAHVDSIRQKVAAAFPGKEVLIGETGWPSQGRMREGALPSPANQARVLHDVLALAERGHYRVNLIEAFDQPWKRFLEGTVGGYWGLHDGRTRQLKFAWGAAVSNHPYWRWQAAGGVVLAALIFLAAWLAARSHKDAIPRRMWVGIAVGATAAGICASLAVENMLVQAFGIGGWVRSIALATAASLTPLAATVALGRRTALPAFSDLLGHAQMRVKQPIALACGWLCLAVTVLALQAALGLTFDPRYRDFPYAALTAAAVPLLALRLLVPHPAGPGAAETLAAATLMLCAVYIAFNEGFANWQSLWLCAVLAALAVILRRGRGVPG